MKKRLSYTTRFIITGLFSLVTILLLFWEYTHDGVPVHYIFHSDTMPGISNWWGLLSAPLFGWLSTSFIRYEAVLEERKALLHIVGRASSTLFLAVLISYSFISNTESSIPVYLTMALAGVSFFIPIYKTEYLLGYVLGSMFTFGTIIPVVAGCILWSLFYVFYKTPRKIAALVTHKSTH